MKNIFKTRKDEIIDNVGEDGIKKLQKVRLLRLIESEIRKMTNYHTLGQILQSINIEFGLSISKTVFYGFCSKNINEKPKTLKRDKSEEGVSQKIDTNQDKKSIKNIDDLNDSTLDFLSKNLPKK